MTRGERKSLWLGLAFISPWIVGVLVFTLYPVVASIGYSFCDYDVLSKPVWIGAMNYRDMALDAVFWKSLRNTLFFAAWALPLGLVVSLFTAVLLNQPVRGRSLFRTIFFLPSLVPVVAGGMIWLWILNGRFGLLNAGLAAIGIEPEDANTVPVGADAAQSGAPATDTPTEAETAPKARTPREGTKQATLIAMLRAPDGATIEEIMAATGWQSHTVRGAMAGALKKKLGLEVTSEKVEDRGRVYKLPAA